MGPFTLSFGDPKSALETGRTVGDVRIARGSMCVADKDTEAVVEVSKMVGCLCTYIGSGALFLYSCDKSYSIEE